MSRIYKILDRPSWEDALGSGAFTGSPIDLADGYIHFSTASQAPDTARKYFSGQADLLLLAVEADALGPTLKWEPARGGALFPHLYGPLATDLVLQVRELGLDEAGVPQLGELEP